MPLRRTDRRTRTDGGTIRIGHTTWDGCSQDSKNARRRPCERSSSGTSHCSRKSRIGSVDQFLHRVSGGNGDGDGSVRWRYALIEEKTLPRNSPAALVAIWGVCVQIAQERAWGNQRVRVQMPDDELGEELCAHLERFAEAVSEERQKPADPFPDIRGEIGSWFRKRGHPLNAFAEVLWHFARHDHSGVADAPDWLSESLTRWARELVKEAADSGPTLLRQFVTRAQGHTVHGQSVRWDPNRTRFGSVPWSLRKRFQDAPPANTVVVGDQPVRYASPLCSLWIAADESGYRVHENRAFHRSTKPRPLVLHAGGNGRERRQRRVRAVDVAAETQCTRQSLPHGRGMRA